MCVECDKLLCKEKYKKDPSRRLAASAKWRENNKHKQKAAVRRWEIKNQDRKNEQRAKRRALEKYAIPGWADRKAINAIFKEARERKMVVDHIVPLSSNIVCGLHVETNLQLLTAYENKKKHNKFDGTAA